MTNRIPLDKWLGHIEKEYLDSFIKEGGSAVKFTIVDEKNPLPLVSKLQDSCNRRNFFFASMDAIDSRVYMPQDIFFSLARQIDWQKLARRVVLDMLRSRDFRIPDFDIMESKNIIETVAKANNIEANTLFYELRPLIEKKTVKNPYLVKAFRVAMTHFCIAEKYGSQDKQPLLEWLRGTNTRITNVKPFQIHTPINRTTARYFIESAVHWIRLAGYSGTVILLDNNRVTLAKNPKDGSRFYTRAMVMDHYELLREFIDDVNRLSGTLLVTLTNNEFIDIDAPKGWAIYPALRTRVMDDVRDKIIANPVASLVRLS